MIFLCESIRQAVPLVFDFPLEDFATAGIEREKRRTIFRADPGHFGGGTG